MGVVVVDLQKQQWVWACETQMQQATNHPDTEKLIEW